MTRYLPGPAVQGDDTVRRCCPEHDSLAELTQHLVREFASLDVRTIARVIGRAVAAAKLVGLLDDELLMIELVARAQLELCAGHRSEIARLDPQEHPRRGQPRTNAPDPEEALA